MNLLPQIFFIFLIITPITGIFKKNIQ